MVKAFYSWTISSLSLIVGSFHLIVSLTFQMNSLSSLLTVSRHLPDEENMLSAYKAERFKLQTPNGQSVADVGCEPILHMRNFQVSFFV
jgi:hypothetical protein